MADYYVQGYRPPAGVKDKQGVMLWQKTIGVKADGVWGAQSQKAYENYVKKMAKGGIMGFVSGITSVMKAATTQGDKPRAVGRFKVPDAFRTTQAVKNFQKKNGLQADGIWGAQTDRAYREMKQNPFAAIGLAANTITSAITQMEKERQTKARAVRGYSLPKAGMSVWEVKQFQSQNGLKADGIWGRDTQAKWEARQGGVSRTIGKIIDGGLKAATQTARTVKGYTLPRVGMTTAEVKAFQRAQGLEADGIWGKRTQAAWDRLGGIQKASVLVGASSMHVRTQKNGQRKQSPPMTAAPLSGTLGAAMKKGGQNNPLLQTKQQSAYNRYTGPLGTTQTPASVFGTNDIAKRTDYYNQGASVQAQNKRNQFWNSIGQALTDKHTVDTKALREQLEKTAQKVGTNEQVQHMQDVKNWAVGGMNGPAPQQKDNNPHVLQPKGNDSYGSMFTNIDKGMDFSGQTQEQKNETFLEFLENGAPKVLQQVEERMAEKQEKEEARKKQQEAGEARTTWQEYLTEHAITMEKDQDEQNLEALALTYLMYYQGNSNAYENMKRNLQSGYRIWQLDFLTGEPKEGVKAPFGYDAKGNQIANAQLSGVELKQANMYMLQMYRAFGVDTPTDRTYMENVAQQMSDSFDSMFTRGTNLTNFFNAKGLRLNRVDPNSPYEEAENIRWNPQAYRSALDEAIARAKAKGNLTEEQKRIIRAMELGIEPENIVWTGTMVVDKSEVRWSKAGAEKVAYSYGDVLYAFGVIDKATAQACEGVGNMRRSEAAKKDNITGNMFVDEIVSRYLPKLPKMGIDILLDHTIGADWMLGDTGKLMNSLSDILGEKAVDAIKNDVRYKEMDDEEKQNALRKILDTIDLYDKIN